MKKEKISKKLLLPLLYGIMATWLVAIIITAIVVFYFNALPANALLSATVIILLVASPCLKRAAWAYSNARKYHNAEYYYNLGNGQDNRLALRHFESKMKLAAGVWLRRRRLPAVYAYLFVVMATGQWLSSLWVFAAVAAIVLSVLTGLWTMLLAARKISYDKFGNIKQ